MPSCQPAAKPQLQNVSFARPRLQPKLAALAEVATEAASAPSQAPNVRSATADFRLQKLPGKTIILSTLDLSDMAIESPETVAARIRRALPYVPAERIVVALGTAGKTRGSLAVRPSKQPAPKHSDDLPLDFLTGAEIANQPCRWLDEIAAIGFVIVEGLAAMTISMAARIID